MGAMPTIGPRRPRMTSHASLHEEPGRYLLQLDVSHFARAELAVEVVGSTIIVRGKRLEDKTTHPPFSVREQLEESVRLPDDVDPDSVTALYKEGTLELHGRRRRIRRHRVPIGRDFLVSPAAKGC
jgi:HSP20 family molecular chaperone IbpA